MQRATLGLHFSIFKLVSRQGGWCSIHKPGLQWVPSAGQFYSFTVAPACFRGGAQRILEQEATAFGFQAEPAEGGSLS